MFFLSRNRSSDTDCTEDDLLLHMIRHGIENSLFIYLFIYLREREREREMNILVVSAEKQTISAVCLMKLKNPSKGVVGKGIFSNTKNIQKC